MHLEDEAELYALGMLDADERARVEEHLATCDVCAWRVARAEAVIAGLAVLPPSPPALAKARRSNGIYGAAIAVAAALFAGFAFGRTSAPQFYDDAVRTSLVHSHFRHVALRAKTLPGLDAKVLYGSDGAWVWVVIAQTDCRCTVVGYRGTTAVALGDPSPQGITAELYVPNAQRLTRIVLAARGDNSTRAEADLAY
jgi:hypothetical protein